MILAAALALGSMTRLYCAERSELNTSPARGFEGESALSFTISRGGPSNFVQTVQFATEDGTALAATDYVPVSGILTFNPGETSVRVAVPMIDNTRPDGERFFYLRLSNPQPCADLWPFGPICDAPSQGPPRSWGCDGGGRGIVLDDEFPLTRIDPSFVPDYHSSDATGVVLGGGAPGMYGGVTTLSDGKVLALFSPAYEYNWRLVRLLPSGEVDPGFKAQPVGARFHGVLSDGKLLIGEPNTNGTEETLKRINTDGEVDQTFTAYRLQGAAVTAVQQSTGRILVHASLTQYDKPVPGGGYYAIGGLIRLNGDGSVDSSFAPAWGDIGEIFLRNDGRIIVKARGSGEDWKIFQITEDGAKDPSFAIDLDPGLTPVAAWVEQADGRILIPVIHKLRRLNTDGSLDPTFAPYFPEFCSEVGVSSPSITLAGNGDILFRASFSSVDGFPRRGLVRLRNADPVPEFMVLTPAEAYRSGHARIRVIRTGPTDRPAHVDFSTADGTAVQDRDYRPRAGSLEFAPREASKFVEVPLLTNAVVSTGRLSFHLLLKNPSAGYSAIAATAVVLLPDLRVIAGSYLTNRSVRVEGALPGSEYALEISSDLKSWSPTAGYLTSRDGTSIVFSEINFFPGPDIHFFRVRRL